MNYVDIAIIAIIAFFALIGLWKGFGKTFIKLFCFALAVFATWLLADTAVNWVLSAGFVRNFIVGDQFSLYSLYYNSFGEEILNANAATQLSGAMGLYINPMIERFTAMGGPTSYGITYAQFIAVNLSVNTLSIVLCVLIYAVVRIVAIIIAWILKKIIVRGEVKVWSRFVGFVFGAARGALAVAVILIISTIIYPLGFSQPYTQTVGEGIIGNFAAKYTYQAFDAAIYGGENVEKTEKLLESAGFTKGTYPSQEEMALNEKKTNAVNELTAYRDAKDNSLYSEAGKANLDAAKNAGIEKINAATDEAGITAALNEAKANIDAVMTAQQEQELADAKITAKAELQSLRNSLIGEGSEYVEAESEYSETNFNEIKLAHLEGNEAIDKAANVTAVTNALSSAKTKMQSVPKKIHESAIQTLQTYYEENFDSVPEENKQAFTDRYNQGVSQILTTDSENSANTMCNGVIADLEALKTSSTEG